MHLQAKVTCTIPVKPGKSGLKTFTVIPPSKFSSCFSFGSFSRMRFPGTRGSKVPTVKRIIDQQRIHLFRAEGRNWCMDAAARDDHKIDPNRLDVNRPTPVARARASKSGRSSDHWPSSSH